MTAFKERIKPCLYEYFLFGGIFTSFCVYMSIFSSNWDHVHGENVPKQNEF